ncbi:MAG: PAS domain S-box protein [Candidatus Odinarchaeota archaeon]
MSRDSKASTQNLYENAPIGLYRVTPDGKILAANPALVKMLKYDSFEELSSINLENSNQYHPTYPRQVFRERLEREGEIKGFESLWETREGSLILVREHAKVIRGEDGSVIYYEGAVEDITEQKKVIERLLGKEKQYRSIIENATDSIIILNEKGKFRYISPAVKDLVGYRVEELYGKNLDDFIHPDDLSELTNSFQQSVMKPGEIFTTEYRFKHKNGSWRVIESVALNLTDNKAFSGIIFTSRDITTRKEREKRLRYIVEIERALAGLSAMFINLKPDSLEQGLINALRAVGEYACVECGYIRLFANWLEEDKFFTWCVKGLESQLDMIGTLLSDHSTFFLDRLRKFETIYISSIKDLPPEADNEKKKLLEADIQSFIAFPLTSSGQLAGFLGFHSVKHIKKWLAEDVTLIGMFAQTLSNTLEQKRIELNTQRQKEELRLFVDILTHDLKNYHLITREYLQIGVDNLKTKPEELDNLLQQSLAGLMRAENVVSDISFLMKQRLPYEYDLKPVNILTTVNNALETLFQMYPGRKIDILTNQIVPTLNVLADSLFEQLILNLLTNAVKNDKNDEIKIEISANIDNGATPEKTCYFTITDHGQGIPDNLRLDIFERFTSFRKSGEGSGLGMYIVKTLVERYKGKIWIEDRVPGDYTKGTCVKIELQAC